MQIAKKTIGDTSITFTWADETVTTVLIDDLAESLHNRAILHGLSQKLGDSYSGVGGNLELAKSQFEETLAALKAGDWNRAGGGFSTGGIWVEALAKASGESMERALEAWNEMDDEEKKVIRKHPQVKLAKAEIEMQRAEAKAAEAPSISL